MVWKNDQVSKKETEEILRLAGESLKIQGDFVELGCYKGDTSLLLAEILKGLDKKLWLYDSFEGLPAKNKIDESVLGSDFKEGELLVTKSEIKKRFLRAGLKLPMIKKAWFSDLKSDDLPVEIAFAFLDGDFYESIKESLELVENKMTVGGILVVHDYKNEALPGVRKAVDEWLSLRKLKATFFESMIVIKI